MSVALSISIKDLFGKETVENTCDPMILIPSVIFNLSTKLLPRSTCETDEQYLQIIPYITLYDKSNCDIFIYRRGSAGGENRLHGKCSIGLGGHIEMEPNQNRNLKEVIAYEAARELSEETGLAFTSNLVDQIFQKIHTGNCGVIHYRGDAVGRVHIGVSLFFGVDKEEIVETETNVITRGQWCSMDDINNLVDNGDIEMEPWSRIVMGIAR